MQAENYPLRIPQRVARLKRFDRLPSLSTYWPGLLLVIALSLLAVAIEAGERRALGGTSAPVEALVVAILLGMLVRNTLGVPTAFAPGTTFVGKQVLECAVFILGASVNFGQLLQAGPQVLLLIVLCVALGLLVSVAAGRLLGLGPKLAILVASGNAICGNSAIAAVAPAIKADKKDVSVAIALTAVVGVGLVLTLPLLVPLIHLSHYQYGVLVGTTVYAVPQVVAASFPVSVESGQVATFVKLVRVLLLGPVVLCFSMLFAWLEVRKERASAAGGEGDRETRGGVSAATTRVKLVPVPWFIVAFLILAVLNSLGVFASLSTAAGQAPGAFATLTKETSRWLMIAAMAALGLGVEVAAVKTVGPRVLAAVLVSVFFLLLLSLALIFAFRL